MNKECVKKQNAFERLNASLYKGSNDQKLVGWMGWVGTAGTNRKHALGLIKSS